MMRIKKYLYPLFKLIGVIPLSFPAYANTSYQQIKIGKAIIDVVRVDHLDQLQLLLKDQQGNPYNKIDAIQRAFSQCEMTFAMNAGMYHRDYLPVGLYVENSKKYAELNQQKGLFGNFYMQPNGVLAWNSEKAMITTTEQYTKTQFNAEYATQSGPMLVINGEINPQFLAQSDSLKIRNGVGVKENQLYFVISQNRINFYDFARVFKEKLEIDNALYLDGSISSAYIPQVQRYDRAYHLGPMIALFENKKCQ